MFFMIHIEPRNDKNYVVMSHSIDNYAENSIKTRKVKVVWCPFQIIDYWSKLIPKRILSR